MVAGLDVQIGQARSQTFWELFALALSLLAWEGIFAGMRVSLLGDNTAALQSALALKGRGPLVAIARELAWRQVRRSWAYDVGHLPSEHNKVSDALSRMFAPSPSVLPACLRGKPQLPQPEVADFWRARPEQSASNVANEAS